MWSYGACFGKYSIHCLGRSYIKANEALASVNFLYAAKKYFCNATSNHILCGCFKKSGTAATLCYNDQ